MEGQDVYVVSLYSAPMPWPLSFAVHLWFVIEHNGVINRVEVWAPIWRTNSDTNVVVDALPPTKGFRTSYFDSPTHPNRISKATCVATFSGDKKSVAGKLYTVLQSAHETYPIKQRYLLYPGPNSNTFIGWVRKMVPEARLELPWNAFGKGYPLPKI